MADAKTAYGTQGQTLAITLANLASGNARESDYIDNATNKYLDALVYLEVEFAGSGSASTDPYVYVYAYGTVNDGTDYPDAVTGSNAGITLNSPSNLRLLGAIGAPAISVVRGAGPWSVASVFGGVLPARWGIVVRNASGIALGSTEGNHKKLYQGIYSTVG